MSADFAGLYSRLGRPGIPPERLPRALPPQCFYSVCSERQLMERLEFDLLFRWFVGLWMDEFVWDVSVFSKNRTGCCRARWRSGSWRSCWPGRR